MEDIKFEVVYFFDKRFIENEYIRPKLDGIQFSALSSVKSSSLEAPFLLEEIK